MPKPQPAPVQVPAPASPTARFEVGDAVTAGDRPAVVDEVRIGAHYKISFTDDDGGAFQWAAEDEIGPVEDDDKTESAALHALKAERRRLEAALAAQQVSAPLAALVADMKASHRWTPAIEAAMRDAATRSPSSLSAIESVVRAMPPIAALANTKRMPPAGGPNALHREYADLSFAERHELASNDPEMFKALKANHDALARGDSSR